MRKKSASEPRTINEAAAQKRRPWYEEAFTREYLQQYAHRSDAAARCEAPFIARALNLPKGSRVFDLCCGAGRHTRALAKKGLVVIGMDLSADLLNSAAVQAQPRVSYIRGDMRRLPIQSGSFDGVVNLFTSFGYFSSELENQRVLNEVARILKPGAPFLIDYMNISLVLRTLVASSERTTGRLQLRERRWYDERRKRLNKTTQFVCDGEECSRRESVRAYTRAELEKMLRKAGLKVARVFADLSGSDYDARISQRCVLLARKEKRGGTR